MKQLDEEGATRPPFGRAARDATRYGKCPGAGRMASGAWKPWTEYGIASLSRCKRSLLQNSLGGSETRAGDPEGRAGHVIEARLVEKGDALRIAAVLPADPEL